MASEERTDLLSYDVYKRLRKVEGQVRGIQRMLDEGRTNMHIIDQTKAVVSSLKSVIELLYAAHIQNQFFGSAEVDNEKSKSVSEIVEIMRTIK